MNRGTLLFAARSVLCALPLLVLLVLIYCTILSGIIFALIAEFVEWMAGHLIDLHSRSKWWAAELANWCDRPRGTGEDLIY